MGCGPASLASMGGVGADADPVIEPSDQRAGRVAVVGRVGDHLLGMNLYGNVGACGALPQ